MFGTSDERRILWRHMREPVLTAGALLVMLGSMWGWGPPSPSRMSGSSSFWWRAPWW